MPNDTSFNVRTELFRALCAEVCHEEVLEPGASPPLARGSAHGLHRVLRQARRARDRGARLAAQLLGEPAQAASRPPLAAHRSAHGLTQAIRPRLLVKLDPQVLYCVISRWFLGISLRRSTNDESPMPMTRHTVDNLIE